MRAAESELVGGRGWRMADGGRGWRMRLADAVGGCGWRMRLADAVGGREGPGRLREGAALIAGALLLLVPTLAAANGFEDLFGVGSRGRAMGGAATALAGDHGAVYHNPAAIAFCNQHHLELGYERVGFNFGVEANEPVPEPKGAEDRDTVTLGMCVPLPLGFGFGLYYAQGLQRPMSLDQQSLDATPRFDIYGNRLDQLSIQVGPAYRVLSNLAVGASISVLAHSTVVVRNDVPVVSDSEVSNDLTWDLGPTAAIYAGLRYVPIESLAMGAVYRSALYHKLHVLAPTKVDAAGVIISLDLLLEGVTWYAPQQAALGTVYTFAQAWTVALDATWYDWSEYPGPFIVASPASNEDFAATLNFPPREPPRFHDVVVPRLGLEYEAPAHWAVRGGYSYRVSPAPPPSRRSNLLDGDMHVLTLGGGYRHEFGDAAVAALFIDGFAALGIMPWQVIRKDGSQPTLNVYQFGGSYLNAGLTAGVAY